MTATLECDLCKKTIWEDDRRFFWFFRIRRGHWHATEHLRSSTKQLDICLTCWEQLPIALAGIRLKYKRSAEADGQAQVLP